MAKKKSTSRKAKTTASSKAASIAPSSPSPPPQDPVHRRRKSTPIRSPSHADQSKGIVFSFRFKNDPKLSMAVNILSYDQQFGPPDPLDSEMCLDSASVSLGSSQVVPPTAPSVASPVQGLSSTCPDITSSSTLAATFSTTSTTTISSSSPSSLPQPTTASISSSIPSAAAPTMTSTVPNQKSQVQPLKAEVQAEVQAFTQGRPTTTVTSAFSLAESHLDPSSSSSPPSCMASQSTSPSPSASASSSSSNPVHIHTRTPRGASEMAWSSDPSLFRSSNVVDLSRNLLILHTRKPTEHRQLESSSSFHPYHPRRKTTSSSSSSSSSTSSLSSLLEDPSTPCLTPSGEMSESSSPSSSPASPSSPTLTSVPDSKGRGKDEEYPFLSLDSLPQPLEQMGTNTSTRFLNVRGLGASGARRMQVILVS
ncbi:hypothetical protein BGZ94_003363 [Podila epigama]|nr:hypothetical protein BGZ94_003363 [Podila epigama]